MRKCENDINSLKAELQRCRPGTSQHQMYKRRILAAMRDRKRIDQQLGQSFAMQSNLSAVQDASYQSAYTCVIVPLSTLIVSYNVVEAVF